MKTNLLVACAIALLHGCSPQSTAPNSVELDDFAGVWEVIPSPPRIPPFARLFGAPEVPRDEEGRPLGFGVNDEGLDFGDVMVRRMMTDEGRAAFAEFDPLQLPANNCESPGLPSIVMTPYLQEWSVSEDSLTITHEYFSTVRQALLGEDPSPAQEHTSFGFTAARLDGSELVVTTTKLSATAGGLSRNAPASDAREVEERYRLSPDGNSLEGEITISDSKFLTRELNLSVSMRRAKEGTEIYHFPCDLEASRRHL